MIVSATHRSKMRRHAGHRPRAAWTAALLSAFALALPFGAGAQASPEVLVTMSPVWDFEFDSARNGKECPSCNFNGGNSRFAWIDNDRNLWLGWIDFQTGAFLPTDGKGQLLDTEAVPIATFGNGPEWMSSATWGSQIVFTRWNPGQAGRPSKSTIAVATTQANWSWTTAVLPDSLSRATPVGTLDETDADPRVNYIKYDKTGMYWRKMSQPDVEHVMAISDMTEGNARRWVPGTRKMVFQGTPRSAGATDAGSARLPTKPAADQIYTIDTDTGELEQLTNDSSGFVGAFMWNAPEYDNELLLMTTPSARKSIKVFRKVDGTWTVIKTVNAPPGLPFFFSPEPMVHNGRSYLVFQVSPSSKFYDKTVPSHVGISGIQRRDEVNVLSAGGPDRLRLDPEYFITAKGPYIYYKRSIPETPTTPPINDGVWYIDTKLGPPRP